MRSISARNVLARGARIVDFGSVADASVVEEVHRDPCHVIRNTHVSTNKVACCRLERKEDTDGGASDPVTWGGALLIINVLE